MVASWCRACGMAQLSQLGACSECGVDLAVTAPADWPLGLVYEGRGALGLTKRYGVCVGFDQESLLLHFSAKEKEFTQVPRHTTPTAHVPATLSAASRLLYAAGSNPRTTWNVELLREQAAHLCRDIRALRRLFDDSLTLGWAHVTEWAPLTASEKAWRGAHHAASLGDLVALRRSLLELPPTGYAARAYLLMPHLAALRTDPDAWRPVVQSLKTADAELGFDVLVCSLGGPSKALEKGVGLLPGGAQAGWHALWAAFESGASVPPPSGPGQPAWTALSLISSPERIRLLDGHLHEVAGVEPSLLDDLVDSGRLSAAAPLASLADRPRVHLLARLDPARLSDAEVREAGHLSEYARRKFVTRDRAQLLGLDPTPRVAHYQALLEVVEGGRPDPARLDEQTLRALSLPDKALQDLKDGTIRCLPDDVAADPSLWPMFSELAITGALSPDTSKPPNHPLNTWIGLKRLLGLIWESRYSDAVDHGRLLAPHIADERARDEASNLTAFALDQLGRSGEALAALEDALRGEYTENLLVNVSLVASRVAPDVGMRHLARLVNEAPTPDLRRAGLTRAIVVWQETSEPFPQVLIPHLTRMLDQPSSLDDYLFFSDVIVTASPESVPLLNNPEGVYAAPFKILKARARLRTDERFFLADLAREFVSVHREVGRPAWFADQWKSWVEIVEEAVFVDFGEALGAAGFIDEVLKTAPQLFDQRQRFVLAPQAGAHTSAALFKDDAWLSSEAWHKFFLRPVDEFLAERNSLEPGLADYLASNFTLCMANAGFKTLALTRDSCASDFNAIIDRLRWDSENRLQLLLRREASLRETEEGPLRLMHEIVRRLQRLGSVKREKLTQELAQAVADWQQEIDKFKVRG